MIGLVVPIALVVANLVATLPGRLGDAGASTTLDIYSHFLPERDREAAEIQGALLDSPIS